MAHTVAVTRHSIRTTTGNWGGAWPRRSIRTRAIGQHSAKVHRKGSPRTANRGEYHIYIYVYLNLPEDLAAGSMTIDAINLPACCHASPPRYPYVIFSPLIPTTERNRRRRFFGGGETGDEVGDRGRSSAIIYPNCRPSNQSCRHMLK